MIRSARACSLCHAKNRPHDPSPPSPELGVRGEEGAGVGSVTRCLLHLESEVRSQPKQHTKLLKAVLLVVRHIITFRFLKQMPLAQALDANAKLGRNHKVAFYKYALVARESDPSTEDLLYMFAG